MTSLGNVASENRTTSEKNLAEVLLWLQTPTIRDNVLIPKE